VPPNYGAPPNWRPAILPHGQEWPPPGKWSGDDDRQRQGNDRDRNRDRERDPGPHGPSGGWSEPGQDGGR
jgi:cell division protease FtsH